MMPEKERRKLLYLSFSTVEHNLQLQPRRTFAVETRQMYLVSLGFQAVISTASNELHDCQLRSLPRKDDQKTGESRQQRANTHVKG